jgi:hypothetical protein
LPWSLAAECGDQNHWMWHEWDRYQNWHGRSVEDP